MGRSRFKLHLHDLCREDGIHYPVNLEQALLAYQWLCMTVRKTDREYGRWGDYTPWNLIDAKSSVGGDQPAELASKKELNRRFRHVFLSKGGEMTNRWRKREHIGLNETRWIQGPILDDDSNLRILLPDEYVNRERDELAKRPLVVHLNPVWVDAVEVYGPKIQLIWYPGMRAPAYWTVTLRYGYNHSAWEDVLTNSRPGEAPETWASRAVQWWRWLVSRYDAAFVERDISGWFVFRDRQTCTAGIPLRYADCTEEHKATNHHHYQPCRWEKLAGPFEKRVEAEDAAIEINNR